MGLACFTKKKMRDYCISERESQQKTLAAYLTLDYIFALLLENETKGRGEG